MICGFYLAAILVSLGSVATSASAQVTFKHKFPDGRTSTSVTQIATSQTLTLAGMEIKSGSEQSLTVTSTNGQRAADGTLSVTSKIDAIIAAVTLPGGVELKFDSAKPDAAPPGTQFDFLLDVFKATAKSTWESVLNRDNRIVQVKGRDEVYADLPQNLRDAMKGQLDPEYLVTVANDELAKLPSGAVSPGDSWERTNTMRLEAGQRLEFTNKYTYEGSVQQDGKKFEKIVAAITAVKYSVEGESPLKVLESDLKIAASEGVILFDPAAGQIDSHHSKVQIKGSLKLAVNGMELPGQLDLTIENSAKLK